jgi:ABC-type amino acid transport substrate-binding protein
VPAPFATVAPVPISLPLATVVTIATVAATAAPQTDDVWDRIVANKKIVVGTSWDYPPFASVDPNFQVVGFDMALIQEIGHRLNLPVEVQNFAFEGLTGALQVNQIDLAIAAISVTPERASQMSFSQVYYVNQTAVLARNDSTVPTITDINQLAGLRIGVQRGSTYEVMVQSLLVNNGLIQADQLLSFVKADEAVAALVAKKVDLVVTGQATASYYHSSQGLRVIGQGFNQQDLAVAMRLGTPHLKSEIDRVMGDMLKDGTILGFIKKYMQDDVTGILPTPIPLTQPTATPVPTAAPAACVDGMKFVSDVNFADNNMKTPVIIKPGEGFIKTWRVQNTGTCTWTSDYRLVYAYGNVAAALMGGQPINISGNVAPGQTSDLSVTLIAPKEQNIYQGFWQIENAQGGRFGQTIWVGISTRSGQATPVATVQPSGDSCVVTNTAPTTSVVAHSTFDAVWTVKNVSGKDWLTDSVDYKFISGTEMHEKAVYDFTQIIKNGESGKIIVDMVAPATPGVYSAQWAIMSANTILCTLNVTVTVVAK